MRRLALLLFLLLPLLPVTAQTNCGKGLPCGPVPWSLPKMPDLESPTPAPTYAYTAQATNVSGSVPTPAPMPTNPPLADVDTSDINDSLSTLNAIMAETAEPVLNAEGTAVVIADELLELETGA